MEHTLRVAIEVAKALAELHRDGLIHQHVRPQCIPIDPQSGRARLAAPPGAAGEPGGDAGFTLESLPYMAPEQTGRMNRPVDHRVDLYALGVTLYQMISGRLPLEADEPIGWIHAHIAKVPTPLAEAAPDTPPALCDIVMKLLAKVADDRYQSARGLMLDLERCLHELEARGRLDRFPLGAQDFWERIRIPAKLYGRDAEIAELIAGFERVVGAAAPELLLVRGYSGIGKSALVQELQRPVARERGFFISGKFEQHKRDIPYSVLGSALRELSRQILTESDARLAAWRRDLVEALGSHGRLITALVPEVELIVGAQPPVPPLPASDEQNRFQAAFRRFLSVFATREHPLVLFLDDLQWADLATLRLLRHVLTHPEVRHLLLVGAYRDHEVSASHPLATTLDEMTRAGARITAVTLAPLPLGPLQQLVADTVRSDAARAAPLSALVLEKTGGNPFFITQFLTELESERLVWLDALDALDVEQRRFRWDIEAIRAKRFTENVVELMIGKLLRLPAGTQAALRAAACVGNELDVGLLSAICELGPEEAHRALAPAAREGLLLRRGDAYRFLHDRVQQAAFALIPEEQRSAMHLSVGRLLLARTPEAELPERIFDICNHLNLAASLIDAPEERRRLAELNLRAGRRAKASAAYTSAAAYLAAGAGLLGERGWESEHALAFQLNLELAECQFLSGAFDDVERRAAELLPRAVTRIERASVYRLRIQLHTARTENKKGIELATECLALFGIDLPADPGADRVLAEIQRILDERRGRPIEELLLMPAMSDPEMIAAMAVLAAVYLAALYSQPNVTDLLVCHMVRISMAHGIGGESATGYASFGVALCTRLGAYHDGYRFGKLAYDITDRYGLVGPKAEVCTRFASMISHWTRHISTNIEYCGIGLQAAIEVGNITYACIHRVQLVMSMVFKGERLDEVHRDSLRAQDFVLKAKFPAVMSTITSVQRFALNMQEQTDHFSTFSGDGFDEAAFEAELERTIPLRVSYYYLLKLVARVVSNDSAAAKAAADAARKHMWSHAALWTYPEFHFFSALAAAALLDEAEGDGREELSRELHATREKLAVWAESCPDNYLGKHALVAAEIARIEGRHGEASEHYEAAARAFRASGFVHKEAICHELAARFYAARGLAAMAAACMREARSLYERWGARGKVRQLDHRYGALLGAEEPAPPRALATSVEQLDTAVIVRATQALSREIVFDGLVSRLMHLLVEHAGARRCCLLLPRNGGLYPAASAAVEGGGVSVSLPRGAAPDEVELPWSIIHFVRRTSERVILDDATLAPTYAPDEYIARVRPKSLLCVPAQLHGESAGVLYLENDLTIGAFSPRHLAILEFLAAQTAISLENVKLYEALTRENAERRGAEAQLLEHLRIIEQQREAIQQLSAPMIEVWEGVLMMPVIGIIDSSRAQQMMDALLKAVARTRCSDAIIDLTGVDVIDTRTADHIVRLMMALRLLGARGIVVGIQPTVAQTLVTLGVDLSEVVTLATVRQALLFCMRKPGIRAR